MSGPSDKTVSPGEPGYAAEIQRAVDSINSTGAGVSSGAIQNVFLAAVDDDGRCYVLLLLGGTGDGLKLAGTVDLLKRRLLDGLAAKVGE